VGLDLPWGAPIGFQREAAPGRDRVTDKVARFLARYADDFGYGFISYQPRDRALPHAADLAAAYDDVLGRMHGPRALHHTVLNLGACEPYPRDAIIEFTNDLIARHQFAWVNEDLGLWSLGGRPLPYPLPPQLTTAGLSACVRNVRAVADGLTAPLVIEFPGFAEGLSLEVGSLDAYDFFRRVVSDAGVAATLDVGHLLSYRWRHGHRGEALYADLERLPLAATFELHLSGCAIIDGERFMDYHHGVLLDEQLELTARLLPLCPNLQAITYEDPKFDAEGALIPSAVPNYLRLKALVAEWMSAPIKIEKNPGEITYVEHEHDTASGIATDRRLELLLRDSAARAAFLTAPPAAPDPLATLRPAELSAAAHTLSRETLRRRQVGCGDLRAAYPLTLAALTASRGSLDAVTVAFLASPAYTTFRETPGDPGACLEDAFYRFCVAATTPAECPRRALAHEHLLALVKALTICPRPGFIIPPELRPCPGGWVAVHRAAPTDADPDRDAAPHLFAAAHGRVIAGELTPLLADLIDLGPAAAARHPGTPPAVTAAALTQLRSLGVLPDADAAATASRSPPSPAAV